MTVLAIPAKAKTATLRSEAKDFILFTKKVRGETRSRDFD